MYDLITLITMCSTRHEGRLYACPTHLHLDLVVIVGGDGILVDDTAGKKLDSALDSGDL